MKRCFILFLSLLLCLVIAAVIENNHVDSVAKEELKLSEDETEVEFANN